MSEFVESDPLVSEFWVVLEDIDSLISFIEECFF